MLCNTKVTKVYPQFEIALYRNRIDILLTGERETSSLRH